MWIESLRSTYNHPAKDCFPTNESKHVTIISNMLPYSLSYKNYLIDDIRSDLPNIHINMNIPHIHFCIDIQKSTDSIGPYIVVNPSGQNWADIAFLAPTLCANNLLEIGIDSEKKLVSYSTRRRCMRQICSHTLVFVNSSHFRHSSEITV